MSAASNSQSTLDVTHRDFADCRLVRVGGRVDHTNSTVFHEDLGRHAGAVAQGGGMVIDLARLEFITSAGLRALLLAHRTIAEAGGRLIVTGIAGVVKDVFRVSKFDSLLGVAETVEQAVGQVSDAAAGAYRG